MVREGAAALRGEQGQLVVVLGAVAGKVPNPGALAEKALHHSAADAAGAAGDQHRASR